tara:strand:+ start:3654 stop:4565 length:912 start_codon:yes stop_codon:yes gene_type:complete
MVIGSINLDLVLETGRLPSPGETVLGGKFSRINGGKGANQAVAAARGGNLNVAFLSAVGDDDFGRSVVQDYQAEPRLNAAFIVEKSGFATGVAAILVDQHAENMICVAPGANAELSVSDVDLIDDQHFMKVTVLLASLEVPLDTIHVAVRRSKASGATIILNPAPVVPGLAAHAVLDDVDILTPNEHEAGKLSGIQVSDVGSAVQAARVIISQFGIGTVVVTMGSLGVVVVYQDEYFEVKAPPVKARDTTAAGDCFNGVLAAQLAAAVEFPEAVALAVRAASLSVTRRGAQTSLPEFAEFASE